MTQTGKERASARNGPSPQAEIYSGSQQTATASLSPTGNNDFRGSLTTLPISKQVPDTYLGGFQRQA
ncbi:uncharacterized protein N7446_010676 [Penicillium canescens]|uniref:Uncharacterized protein n=1 Tax=Penicillium canescens TaxID=5083 RepID=A0AAD6IBG5_PENCN|nr:uncharacterized protein N7446_010676 [Penicillium canescens]KAJ6041435.1 hypothetical protein N7460_006825 [Penicillium canescens]KAJ6050567.1 hypothetical protein N7446_010676 [Penicillium canescens]KAJ6065787.1 hypothetical protein N7444_001440 [Penicillium canescens]